jgi:hypothetical protein
MAYTARMNYRVQKPVYHLSINWPPDEKPTQEQMQYTADRLLRDLGLHEHHVLMVAHRDTEHHHVHLAINRVHPETLRAWRHNHDRARIRASLNRIEREMGWRVVAGSSRNLSAPPPAEVARLRGAALEPMQKAHNWGELEELLKARGLSLRARGRGLVITDGKYTLKASAVDRSLSRGKLEERFRMTYPEWRQEVKQLRRLTAEHRQVSHRIARQVAPAGVVATVNRHRQRAAQLRSALEGSGDLAMIERKMAAFSVRFGAATLRRVSPAAATILWAARMAKRTLDRERSR